MECRAQLWATRRTPPTMTTALDEGLIEDFRRHILDSNFSPNTARGYRADMIQFLDWADEPPVLDELDGLARAWLTYGSADKSRATVRRRLATMKVFGRWLGLNQGFLENYKAPRLDPTEAHPLPGGIEAVERLLYEAEDSAEYVLVVLCAFMGLRVNEAVTVTGANVNQKARTLLVPGKGAKKRILPLTERTFPVVAAAGLSVGFQDKPLVALANSTARLRIRNLGERSDVPQLASHDLRAWFATDMYQRTHDLLATQKWMGHSHPDTTRRYILTNIDTMRAAGL